MQASIRPCCAATAQLVVVSVPGMVEMCKATTLNPDSRTAQVLPNSYACSIGGVSLQHDPRRMFSYLVCSSQRNTEVKRLLFYEHGKTPPLSNGRSPSALTNHAFTWRHRAGPRTGRCEDAACARLPRCLVRDMCIMCSWVACVCAGDVHGDCPQHESALGRRKLASLSSAHKHLQRKIAVLLQRARCAAVTNGRARLDLCASGCAVYTDGIAHPATDVGSLLRPGPRSACRGGVACEDRALPV